MMRTWMPVMVGLVLVGGCGGPSSGFKDPAEELAYLNALSNPTPEQWRRREAIKAERGEEDARRKQAEADRPPEVGSVMKQPKPWSSLELYDEVEGMKAKDNAKRITSINPGDEISVDAIRPDAVRVTLRARAGGREVKPRVGYRDPDAAVTGYVERWWDGK